MDPEDKNRITVEPFKLQVLGGEFTVQELVLQDDQDQAEFQASLMDIPSDRWFVMLAEGEENTQDTLAIIDDNFEFQIYAVGSFENE